MDLSQVNTIPMLFVHAHQPGRFRFGRGPKRACIFDGAPRAFRGQRLFHGQQREAVAVDQHGSKLPILVGGRNQEGVFRHAVGIGLHIAIHWGLRMPFVQQIHPERLAFQWVNDIPGNAAVTPIRGPNNPDIAVAHRQEERIAAVVGSGVGPQGLDGIGIDFGDVGGPPVAADDNIAVVQLQGAGVCPFPIHRVGGGETV